MNSRTSPLPPFDPPYAPDDGAIAAWLLKTAHLSAEQNARIDRTPADYYRWHCAQEIGSNSRFKFTQLI